MTIMDEKIKNKLKKILLENIVYITVFIMIFIYFLFEGNLVEIAVIIVFLPWFYFSTLFFGALLDWSTFPSLKCSLLVSLILSLLSSLIFYLIGLKEVVYLLLLFALTIGLFIAIVLMVSSALKNRKR